MLKLEDLQTGTRVKGLAPGGVATVESVTWIGDQALKAIYRDAVGQLGEKLFPSSSCHELLPDCAGQVA